MIVVLMGVCGSGKTTLGRMLAARLGWSYVEGDDFHPPANVAKMRAGTPLDDADRRPWLAALAARIAEWDEAGTSAVLACSALKRAYRDALAGSGAVRFVHLKGPRALVAARLSRRAGHYMPASLLDSQLAALEEPGPDEDAIAVDIARPPEEIVARLIADLGLRC